MTAARDHERFLARMARWDERAGQAKPRPRRTRRSSKPVSHDRLPDWHSALVARVKQRLAHGANGCLEWTGATTKEGYGRVPHEGKLYLPHRIVLQNQLGRLLGRTEQACHRCDNPRCCNPEHLFAGSRADNMRDAFEKGRLNMPHGLRPETAERLRATAAANENADREAS